MITFTAETMPAKVELPEELRVFCATTDHEVALELLTVDPQDWPHLAHLSTGEVVVDDEGCLRVAVWSYSQAASNLLLTGRAVLMFTSSEGVYEIRCRANRLPLLEDQPNLRAFRLQPTYVRSKNAPYADILSGIRFRLHDPAEAHHRWALLREALLALPA